MTRPVFEFQGFEIFTARREIRRDGEPLAVEPKVYDLILYLLERRDRAITKEELQEAVWPGVVVTESALTRCVMKARGVLGDDGREKKVIKTVHSIGYQFVAEVNEHTDGSVSAGSTAQHSKQHMTLAVLPFQNLGEQEHAFIAEGLSQDIVTDLARNTWLSVVARPSADSYSSGDIDHRIASEELGAQYLVEGSVRRSGDKLRITASLTNAASGTREWSERYDCPLQELFEVQDEIARSIASSLGSHVRRAEGREARRADPDALDAWGLIHRGMAISWSRFNRPSNEEAQSLYRRAIEIEPENPRAMAFLACSLAMRVSNGWSQDIAGDSEEAWRLGRRAIELSPDDPMVLTSFGHQNTCLGRGQDAVLAIERAIELDPSSAWGVGVLAFAKTAVGRAEEALEHVSTALRLSPRDVAEHWYLSMFSWAYLQLGQYDDAAREAQRSINAFAGWQVPWATLAVARAGLGEWDRAREAAEVAAGLESLVDAEGFKKFFGFVVRDPERGAEVALWLDRIWPAAAA